MKVEIDEKILTEIAQQTDGKYFRATDNDKLKTIYDEINQMEKNRVEVENLTLYHERFTFFALAALILLVAEYLIRNLWLRQIP